MKHSWTKNEISWFVVYENLLNESEMVDHGFLLLLQAKLLIANKYLVGYVNGIRQKELFTFSETLTWEKYYAQRSMLFTTHPINFSSDKEYVVYSQDNKNLKKL